MLPTEIADFFNPNRPTPFIERVMNGQVTQKDGGKEVRRILTDNNLINELVEVKTGIPLPPEAIQYTQGKPNANLYDIDESNLRDLLTKIRGKGIKSHSTIRRTHQPTSRYPADRGILGIKSHQPMSRYPTGREILGYGLCVPKKSAVKKAIQIDISKGLAYEPAPSYVPFGKYIVNPNKLSSGVFEIKTMRGGMVAKYPLKRLSPNLSKIMNRIIGGRMPDEYDFNEMDLEDQHFLYNLSNDAKIMDRIKLPTPKRTKDNEESNRFEILKGQIIAGNDNKDLVKEFKQMLVKFSNDGRIKKNEAREILLDLAALGV
jgi:hypothetical protein